MYKNPQMYPASWESRAFTQWPSRKQQNLTGPRLQEAPRAEGPLQLEAPRAEAVHQQEDASLEGRQLAEGRPMQAAGAAQIAADGEAPIV